jgi:hypothetical protein
MSGLASTLGGVGVFSTGFYEQKEQSQNLIGLKKDRRGSGWTMSARREASGEQCERKDKSYHHQHPGKKSS